MQIHELNNFEDQLGASAYIAVDNGADTGKASIEQITAPLNQRIDNIIAGDAPSAAEVVDARLGANGVTYPSLGDAIREQFDEVDENIDELLNVSEVLSDLTYLTVENGFYRYGVFTANSGYRSYKYKVDPDTHYYATAYAVFGALGYGICQYFDSDNNYLSVEEVESGSVYTDYKIITPSDCAYVIVINKYDGSHTYAQGYGKLKKANLISNRLEQIQAAAGAISVSLLNDIVTITKKYNDTHNLRITMEKCGSSSLMQLYGFYFDAIAEGATSFSKVSNSDWMGPYKVLADSNPTTNPGSSWYYTGGWHGADNSANGYPTAETIEYSVTVDGKTVPSDGSVVVGSEVSVYVKNHICGNNTTDTTGGNDYRYILQEEITYTFKADRCEVQNLITALEDLHIREYYGLQIASNSAKWMKRQSGYGTDIKDIVLNDSNVSDTFLFNPEFLVAVDNNSNYVIAHTEHIGLGEETYNHYSTGQGGHISNGKMYWDLVYASPYLPLTAGERAYVKGWYKWSPTENIK